MAPLWALVFLLPLIAFAQVNNVQVYEGAWVVGARMFIYAWGSDDLVNQVTLEGSPSSTTVTEQFTAVQLVDDFPGVQVYSITIPILFQSDNEILFTIGNSGDASVTGSVPLPVNTNPKAYLTDEIFWHVYVGVWAVPSIASPTNTVAFSATLIPNPDNTGNAKVDRIVLIDSKRKILEDFYFQNVNVTSVPTLLYLWKVESNLPTNEIFAVACRGKKVLSDSFASPLTYSWVSYKTSDNVVDRGSSFSVSAVSNNNSIASYLQYEYTKTGFPPTVVSVNLNDFQLSKSFINLHTFQVSAGEFSTVSTITVKLFGPASVLYLPTQVVQIVAFEASVTPSPIELGGTLTILTKSVPRRKICRAIIIGYSGEFPIKGAAISYTFYDRWIEEYWTILIDREIGSNFNSCDNLKVTFYGCSPGSKPLTDVITVPILRPNTLELGSDSSYAVVNSTLSINGANQGPNPVTVNMISVIGSPSNNAFGFEVNPPVTVATSDSTFIKSILIPTLFSSDTSLQFNAFDGTQSLNVNIFTLPIAKLTWSINPSFIIKRSFVNVRANSNITLKIDSILVSALDGIQIIKEISFPLQPPAEIVASSNGSSEVFVFNYDAQQWDNLAIELFQMKAYLNGKLVSSTVGLVPVQVVTLSSSSSIAPLNQIIDLNAISLFDQQITNFIVYYGGEEESTTFNTSVQSISANQQTSIGSFQVLAEMFSSTSFTLTVSLMSSNITLTTLEIPLLVVQIATQPNSNVVTNEDMAIYAMVNVSYTADEIQITGDVAGSDTITGIFPLTEQLEQISSILLTSKYDSSSFLIIQLLYDRNPLLPMPYTIPIYAFSIFSAEQYAVLGGTINLQAVSKTAVFCQSVVVSAVGTAFQTVPIGQPVTSAPTSIGSFVLDSVTFSDAASITIDAFSDSEQLNLSSLILAVASVTVSTNPSFGVIGGTLVISASSNIENFQLEAIEASAIVGGSPVSVTIPVPSGIFLGPDSLELVTWDVPQSFNTASEITLTPIAAGSLAIESPLSVPVSYVTVNAAPNVSFGGGNVAVSGSGSISMQVTQIRITPSSGTRGVYFQGLPQPVNILGNDVFLTNFEIPLSFDEISDFAIDLFNDSTLLNNAPATVTIDNNLTQIALLVDPPFYQINSILNISAVVQGVATIDAISISIESGLVGTTIPIAPPIKIRNNTSFLYNYAVSSDFESYPSIFIMPLFNNAPLMQNAYEVTLAELTLSSDSYPLIIGQSFLLSGTTLTPLLITNITCKGLDHQGIGQSNIPILELTSDTATTIFPGAPVALATFTVQADFYGWALMECRAFYNGFSASTVLELPIAFSNVSLTLFATPSAGIIGGNVVISARSGSSNLLVSSIQVKVGEISIFYNLDPMVLAVSTRATTLTSVPVLVEYTAFTEMSIVAFYQGYPYDGTLVVPISFPEVVLSTLPTIAILDGSVMIWGSSADQVAITMVQISSIDGSYSTQIPVSVTLEAGVTTEILDFPITSSFDSTAILIEVFNGTTSLSAQLKVPYFSVEAIGPEFVKLGDTFVIEGAASNTISMNALQVTGNMQASIALIAVEKVLSQTKVSVYTFTVDPVIFAGSTVLSVYFYQDDLVLNPLGTQIDIVDFIAGGVPSPVAIGQNLTLSASCAPSQIVTMFKVFGTGVNPQIFMEITLPQFVSVGAESTVIFSFQVPIEFSSAIDLEIYFYNYSNLLNSSPLVVPIANNAFYLTSDPGYATITNQLTIIGHSTLGTPAVSSVAISCLGTVQGFQFAPVNVGASSTLVSFEVSTIFANCPALTVNAILTNGQLFNPDPLKVEVAIFSWLFDLPHAIANAPLHIQGSCTLEVEIDTLVAVGSNGKSISYRIGDTEISQTFQLISNLNVDQLFLGSNMLTFTALKNENLVSFPLGSIPMLSFTITTEPTVATVGSVISVIATSSLETSVNQVTVTIGTDQIVITSIVPTVLPDTPTLIGLVTIPPTIADQLTINVSDGNDNTLNPPLVVPIRQVKLYVDSSNVLLNSPMYLSASSNVAVDADTVIISGTGSAVQTFSFTPVTLPMLPIDLPTLILGMQFTASPFIEINLFNGPVKLTNAPAVVYISYLALSSYPLYAILNEPLQIIGVSLTDQAMDFLSIAADGTQAEVFTVPLTLTATPATIMSFTPLIDPYQNSDVLDVSIALDGIILNTSALEIPIVRVVLQASPNPWATLGQMLTVQARSPNYPIGVGSVVVTSDIPNSLVQQFTPLVGVLDQSIDTLVAFEVSSTFLNASNVLVNVYSGDGILLTYSAFKIPIAQLSFSTNPIEIMVGSQFSTDAFCNTDISIDKISFTLAGITESFDLNPIVNVSGEDSEAKFLSYWTLPPTTESFFSIQVFRNNVPLNPPFEVQIAPPLPGVLSLSVSPAYFNVKEPLEISASATEGSAITIDSLSISGLGGQDEVFKNFEVPIVLPGGSSLFLAEYIVPEQFGAFSEIFINALFNSNPLLKSPFAVPKANFTLFSVPWVISVGTPVNLAAEAMGNAKISLVQVFGRPPGERNLRALGTTNPYQFIDFDPFISLQEGISLFSSFVVGPQFFGYDTLYVLASFNGVALDPNYHQIPLIQIPSTLQLSTVPFVGTVGALLSVFGTVETQPLLVNLLVVTDASGENSFLVEPTVAILVGTSSTLITSFVIPDLFLGEPFINIMPFYNGQRMMNAPLIVLLASGTPQVILTTSPNAATIGALLEISAGSNGDVPIDSILVTSCSGTLQQVIPLLEPVIVVSPTPTLVALSTPGVEFTWAESLIIQAFYNGFPIQLKSTVPLSSGNWNSLLPQIGVFQAKKCYNIGDLVQIMIYPNAPSYSGFTMRNLKIKFNGRIIWTSPIFNFPANVTPSPQLLTNWSVPADLRNARGGCFWLVLEYHAIIQGCRLIDLFKISSFGISVCGRQNESECRKRRCSSSSSSSSSSSECEGHGSEFVNRVVDRMIVPRVIGNEAFDQGEESISVSEESESLNYPPHNDLSQPIIIGQECIPQANKRIASESDEIIEHSQPCIEEQFHKLTEPEIKMPIGQTIFSIPRFKAEVSFARIVTPLELLTFKFVLSLPVQSITLLIGSERILHKKCNNELQISLDWIVPCVLDSKGEVEFKIIFKLLNGQKMRMLKYLHVKKNPFCAAVNQCDKLNSLPLSERSLDTVQVFREVVQYEESFASNDQSIFGIVDFKQPERMHDFIRQEDEQLTAYISEPHWQQFRSEIDSLPIEEKGNWNKNYCSVKPQCFLQREWSVYSEAVEAKRCRRHMRAFEEGSVEERSVEERSVEEKRSVGMRPKREVIRRMDEVKRRKNEESRERDKQSLRKNEKSTGKRDKLEKKKDPKTKIHKKVRFAIEKHPKEKQSSPGKKSQDRNDKHEEPIEVVESSAHKTKASFAIAVALVIAPVLIFLV